MSDTHFLYSIATLAIGSIIAIFVCYATDTLPTHTPRHSIPVVATTPVTKNCGCCAEITLQELKASRQRLAKLRKQQQAYKEAVELLKQYGLEEGLRRLKQSAPAVASQLERQLQGRPR